MHRRGKVLIVEADSTIQEFLQLVLTDEGYEVALLAHPVNELSLAASFQPDLILLDIVRPADGHKIVSLYRQTIGAVPIIALSTSASIATMTEELEVAACIVKPFNLDDLLHCIQTHSDVLL